MGRKGDLPRFYQVVGEVIEAAKTSTDRSTAGRRRFVPRASYPSVTGITAGSDGGRETRKMRDLVSVGSDPARCEQISLRSVVE